ncbi:MAG: ADP-ribosylglycohydrolase family protein [Chloroflexi bacterium]|jgi:ADP-ribosylglycohydrolase|nr:ADP-ribosylglycohydrolase family protein [Chloroflexota bacterium]
MATIPQDYEERVYAGVLGKIIGVYLGRPFEGWPYDSIIKELGEIKYYVHEQLNKPLIVTDDDISGTFTFLRAMPDYGNTLSLTPAQIGRTWLNYLIEHQTVLWWGGMGNSTEHTAYLRLKAGIDAPRSGSIQLNGQVVAEQIGAQIFIDGWAMIAPGDPALATDLARRAASVSHDGEAIYGAQVLAAMEAQAFVESDIDRLLDVGLSFIPADSLIRRLIDDLREWHQKYVNWQDAFAQIVANYGYDKYGGNCHMIPNHALIILSLLYGEDNFAKTLSIVNTAGWDTDCNSGNVGCLMGIKNGLAGLEAGPDLRGPVADRMYIPTADGGRTVTDALAEAYAVAQIGRALAQDPAPLPKGGARFGFSLPGAVQGWLPDDSVDAKGTTWVENVAGHGTDGGRSLAIHYHALADGRYSRVMRETYPTFGKDQPYKVIASPTLYSGQTLKAQLAADDQNGQPVKARLLVRAFGADDALFAVYSPSTLLQPGQAATLEWRVEVPAGCPIAWVGLELAATPETPGTRADGTVYLDWVDWSGAPDLALDKPAHNGRRWLEAWVQACSTVSPDWEHTYRLIQNEGVGLLIQGTREWRDYAVRARCTPHLAQSFGIAARVQGLRRYYALRLTTGGKAQLVRELDGTSVLAEAPYAWELYQPYALELRVAGNQLTGSIGGQVVLQAQDDSLLDSGAIALVVEEGRVGYDDVEVRPL